MALGNGVLVHGPRYWACAVRGGDGKLEVASGEKPFRAVDIRNPLVRGPARLAEVFALLPEVRRRLPSAQLPFQRPGVAGAMIGSALGLRAIRASRLSPLTQEAIAALLAVGPAAVALRNSELARSTSRSERTSTARSGRRSMSAAALTCSGRFSSPRPRAACSRRVRRRTYAPLRGPPRVWVQSRRRSKSFPGWLETSAIRSLAPSRSQGTSCSTVSSPRSRRPISSRWPRRLCVSASA